LLELCALVGTLIADGDGIYDPRQYNDRLLLGLKGTMSEAELHIMQQRMRQGVLAKARRGELGMAVPTGYVRRQSGEVILDPDEQVQHVIRVIFRKFEEIGTLNGVLRYLVEHHIQLGIRRRSGPDTGELEWHRPNRMTLQTLLKHPIYAGAYAYGRRPIDPQRKVPGYPSRGRTVAGPTGWVALIKDQRPAYISWEQYERNLAQLAANRARSESRGAVRGGAALLAGLVVCGRCGCRLAVSYGERRKGHLYACTRRMIDYAEPACQNLAGPCLDQCVAEQVLAALQPAALALSLEAMQQLERERADLDRLWQQRRERAAYEAERARRSYHLVEPENRLVARSLERQWEEKLLVQQQLEEEHHRVRTAQPRLLTEAERTAIQHLATDIPALWAAPTTTVAERKEIIRQVVERVVVAVEGIPAGAIAEQLNAEGYRPPKRRDHFSAGGVQDLLQRLGIRTGQRRRVSAPDLGPHEWMLADLAREIEMPAVTLYHWLRRGVLTARREEDVRRRWIIRADESEVERLRLRHQRSLGDEAHQRWINRTPQTAMAMT
jgi:hypothetical protein